MTGFGTCRGHLAAWTAALSLAMVRRLVRLLESTAWPDSGFLARPLGGAAVDSRFDQRVYRAMQTCGQQDLPPAALRIHRRRRVRSAADDLPDPFEDQPAEQAANDPGHDCHRLIQQLEHRRLPPPGDRPAGHER